MRNPFIPHNEIDRIKELESYKIIDELESQDYDFLTQIAAQICDAKISLISLITNDQQWFLSHHGLKERATPKEFAFCAHAINKPEDIFIIEDATQDERFHDNPLVTSYPKVIFYAGIPLVNKNGFPLGTICVIDDQPKQLSEKQIESLKLLAKQVIRLLEIRKKTLELEEENNALEKISILFNQSQQINKIGAWELDLATNNVFWTDEVYEIYELANDVIYDKSKAIEFYHPEDRPVISSAIEHAMATQGTFDVECRFITAKNNLKWVRSSGKVLVENGKTIKLVGTFQDITKLKESEQKYQGILNSTFSFIGLLDPKGVLIEANETAIKTAGIQREDVIGKPFWDCYWWQISEATQQKLKDNFKKALEGQEITYEVPIWTANQIPVTILFSMRPVFDEKGNINYIVPEGRPIQEIVDDRFRHKAVLEGTNVGTWEWNVQTGETRFNERWAEMMGYRLSELYPINIETWTKLVHPEDLAESGRLFNECFEKKSEYYDMEVRLRHKDDYWIWVWSKGKIFSWTEDGKPLMIYGTNIDITEKKNTEEQLRINEEIFRGNFEQAAIGMALLDGKGNWLKVNKKLCNILGYKKQELLQLSFKEITHPEDLETDVEVLKELIEGKREGYNTEKRYLHKNGSIVYVILGVSMVRNKNGEILYFISQIVNITKRKLLEFELAKTIAYNQAMMNASSEVAIIGTDITGNITTFNEGAELMLGYTSDEIINIQSPKLFHLPEEVEKVAEDFLKKTGKKIEGFDVFIYNAKKGIAETKEWTYQRKNGSTFSVLLSITAIKQNDTIIGFLGMATDITKMKQTEIEMLTLLQIAESQNERLKNFSYIVSHNLRSHSGGISTLIELIESEFTAFSETDFFEYLKKSSENLSETIKHLTEIVHINLSTKDQLETIYLKPVIDNNISSLISLAQKENIKIINEVDETISARGIPAYLDSIAMNFITNAIKYKSKDRDSYLKIKAEHIGKYTVLQFIDNGLGIDLNKHKNKLFGMYKTFHNHSDSKGIGLFITKNQIESMNGKIEVESETNIGTTFKIFLENEKI